MAIIAGIDEAGYGPVLGPLVVCGVAVRVPHEERDGGLWTRLRHSVTRNISRRDLRLPIVDSKKLYNRKAGLGALERSALTALKVWGRAPASLRDLLQSLSPNVLDELEAYPWYRDFDIDLPVASNAARIATAANALNRDCRANNIEPACFCCEPLLEGHFNRLVNNTRNKAVVLSGLVLRIVDRLMRKADDQTLHVFIDRHGGRVRYVAQLLTAFEGYDLQILEESPARSAYALRRGGADIRVAFVTSGEEQHMPIALASIMGKYVRELFMIGLNRYWQDRVDGLRPTAGYYTDGHRFLTDIADALERASANRTLLVRSR